eukprot:m.807442 g.807442  ORF g.807442 m.807442 type:complete len:312 (-) comp23379_c1_seq3:707-1642(-)
MDVQQVKLMSEDIADYVVLNDNFPNAQIISNVRVRCNPTHNKCRISIWAPYSHGYRQNTNTTKASQHTDLSSSCLVAASCLSRMVETSSSVSSPVRSFLVTIGRSTGVPEASSSAGGGVPSAIRRSSIRLSSQIFLMAAALVDTACMTPFSRRSNCTSPGDCSSCDRASSMWAARAPDLALYVRSSRSVSCSTTIISASAVCISCTAYRKLFCACSDTACRDTVRIDTATSGVVVFSRRTALRSRVECVALQSSVDRAWHTDSKCGDSVLIFSAICNTRSRFFIDGAWRATFRLSRRLFATRTIWRTSKPS